MSAPTSTIQTSTAQEPFAVIGNSVKRADVVGKVTGQAMYAGDLALPGMLHAEIGRAHV